MMLTPFDRLTSAVAIELPSVPARTELSTVIGRAELGVTVTLAVVPGGIPVAAKVTVAVVVPAGSVMSKGELKDPLGDVATAMPLTEVMASVGIPPTMTGWGSMEVVDGGGGSLPVNVNVPEHASSLTRPYPPPLWTPS
jgi:hypothetical protein